MVYSLDQQKAVIESILNDYPLNAMYWVKRKTINPQSNTEEVILNEEGKETYEILDGQQRTISICDFLSNLYSVIQGGNPERIYDGLTKSEKARILNYELMVYICDGNDQEKLKWFETINIAGEVLTRQELRNINYTGTWLTDAKNFFSLKNTNRNNSQGNAYTISNKYVKGNPIRQELLELGLKWISNNNIENYMATNKMSVNADELIDYYISVIDWVKEIFPIYRDYMKGVDWGTLYRNHHEREDLCPNNLEKEIAKLEIDPDITKLSGIFPYLLTKEEKYLSIRSFSKHQKQIAFNQQGKKCPMCKGTSNENKIWKLEDMQADHIKAWSNGGKTEQSNCQVLCKAHNQSKGSK